MKKLLAILLALTACNGAPGIDAGTSDAGPDATTLPEPPSTPQPLGMNVPIPAPTGDSGALCNVPPGSTPFWGDCQGVGSGGSTTLPDGGAGAIWYENDAGQVAALPACTNGDTISWSNGFPSCVLLPSILPDAGVGGIWYQGDAGVPDPVGLNCATGQTLLWLGGVPTCAAYSDGGSGSSSGGGTTLPDAGQGGMWMQDAGGGVPYAVPIGATDQVLTVVSAAPNWVTGIDSTGALPLGNTSATSINIGNATNTTAITLGVETGDTVTVAVNGTTVDQFGSATAVFGASSTYALDFNSTVMGGTIGFSGAAAGAGAGISINGQGAGGTGNGGGSVTLNGGGSTTTGRPGNVILNVTGPSGTPHGAISLEENLVGYASFAPNYDVNHAPAPAATVNPQNAYLYGTSPNGSCGSSATCTPGSVLVNVSAVGGAGSPTEAYFGVTHAGTQFALIGEQSGGSNAALWLGPSITNASVANAAILGNGTTNYINAGTELILSIGTGSYATMNGGNYALQMGGSTQFTWTTAGGSNTSQANTWTQRWYNAQPASSTTATFVSVPIPSAVAVTIQEELTARDHAVAVTGLATCHVVNTYYNVAGAVSSAGTTATVWAVGGSGDCVLTISGANVLVQVNNNSLVTLDAEALVTVESN